METPGLKISETHVQRVFDFTDEVVERYPNRLAGTEARRNAANRIEEEFAKNCDPDSVKVEDFTVHPKSFLKYIPGLVVLYFIGAVLLYFGFPLSALLVYAWQFLYFMPSSPATGNCSTRYFPEPPGIMSTALSNQRAK